MTKRPPAVFAKATKVFNIGLGEDKSRLNSKVLPSGCCSRLSRMNVISYCSAALNAACFLFCSVMISKAFGP